MQSTNKVALITGITGQDGIYLTQFLLELGNYTIHGIVRRNSHKILVIESMKKLFPDKVILHNGDITDFAFIYNIIRETQPDEVYNLAAQSHVHISFMNPLLTADVTGQGVVKILEAIRQTGLSKKTKFLQASSSEMFGSTKNSIQDENTQFDFQSPYAVAKLYAHYSTQLYRKVYGMFASTVISFNHESPYRGDEFVTRKITLAIARILHGDQEYVSLGNLDAQRDWGHAKDIVRGMWIVLNKATVPNDYVLATKECHSVREFATIAFKYVGIDIIWEGTGVNEVGKDAKTHKVLIKIDPKMFRPGEVPYLKGDYAKIKRELGWEPTISFDELVKDMIESDIQYVKNMISLEKTLLPKFSSKL